MKRADGFRSAPDKVFIETTSIHPQSSGFVPVLSPRSWPPDSRAKIERLFLKAFRYRWNCSSDTGSAERFLQISRSLPSIVCVLGSRLASSVYSTTGGETGAAAGSREAGKQLVKTAAASSSWKKGVRRRCERRGVGCKEPRRRRCRGASGRSGDAADGPAPPQPLAVAGLLLATLLKQKASSARRLACVASCKRPDTTHASIFQHPAIRITPPPGRKCLRRPLRYDRSMSMQLRALRLVLLCFLTAPAL